MWFDRWTRRQRQRASYVLLPLLCLIAIVIIRHDLTRDHHLDNEDLRRIRDLPTSLSFDQVHSLCRHHHFPPVLKPGRKVYDLFLFNTEFDWLDIRLNTLAPYVDYFVIVESPHTFSTRPKPLHLLENWDRFRSFHDKIIYRNVTIPKLSGWLWDNEDYLRNSMLHSVFSTLIGTEQEAHAGDVLAVSDIDELIRPEAMTLLRHCDFLARLTLRSKFYRYSFQWLMRGEQWPRPQATVFRSSASSTIAPNDLRMGLLGRSSVLHPWAALQKWWEAGTLWNAGWHCSSCFSTIGEIHNKLASFSHYRYNTAANRDPRTIIDRVRNGTDLFDRKSELADRVPIDEMDIPEYILQQYRENGRFRYFVDRDAEGAGFDDSDFMLQNYHSDDD